ncbi:hypothetical protein AVEN_269210-1 [Araneus ventricosus]|uniref:Uncharacterized protein n=1 Tax=Araneus ventricosus TaxID=182803 RepID=A0A4Y2I3F6_ARAVE|nr:hypothetical protein AVEN_269210-1 [Araneus ventricosus]
MATDNSVISKKQIQPLLHWCCNVRRTTILHKNCAIHTSVLWIAQPATSVQLTCNQLIPLQCWNELVARKRIITCPIDCTTGPKGPISSKKEGANDKCCRKPAPHSERLKMKRQWLHLEWILSCLCSAILSIDRTLEMEMGFV